MVKMISVAARASPLSQAQVKEVLEELQNVVPEIQFSSLYTESTGDKDLKTSLRTVGKTDFFTREIDQLVIDHQCRIAIHSAKDLPESLPSGLKIIAITKGVDPSDSLVMKPGVTFDALPEGAIIATSSERREETIKALRSDFTFIDLRGPILERLKLLDSKADGVVVAEAALLRLNLLSLNRMRLPGSTAPLQGQLAIVARQDDHEMETLFRPLDSRLMKKSLYLGPEYPLKSFKDRFILHMPLLKIKPLFSAEIENVFKKFSSYTDLIFTSKIGVKQFIERLYQKNIPLLTLQKKRCFCVGAATKALLAEYGISSMAPDNEHAEGVIEILKKELTHGVEVLWVHSKSSRPVIGEFLQSKGTSFTSLSLYQPVTIEKIEPVDFQEIKEVIFSSPSTVHAFFKQAYKLPKDLILTPIGPITAQALAEYNQFQENKF